MLLHRLPFVDAPLFGVLLSLSLLLVSAPPAGAQVEARPEDPAADPDRWLLDARWGEVRYGLTVREPIDSLRLEQTHDGSMVRWTLPGRANISLEIHQGVMANDTLYRRFDENETREDPLYAVGDGSGGLVRTTPLRLNVLIADLAAAIEAAGAENVINAEVDKWVDEFDDYVGYINYFAVYPHGEDARPWLYGIALLQLDDFNIVVMRLECELDAAEVGVSTFESMFYSIEVEPPNEAIQRLGVWMEAGDAVLSAMTQADREAAMRDDRLFRIRELVPGRNGRVDEVDIGYMRIWQRHQDEGYYADLLRGLREERGDRDAQLEGIDGFKTPGNALIVQSFYRAQGAQISRLTEYLDADDDRDIDEVWNIKTQLRQPGENRYGRHEGDWVETGVRDDIYPAPNSKPINRIEVVREGTPPRQIVDYVLARERNPDTRLRFPSARPDALPSGDVTDHRWQTPARCYLSQVDAMIVPAVLPADEAKTYGFFVYDADSTSLAIRVMRVEPQPDGGKVVYIRPTIDQPEQAMVFDRDGELVRWLFPDGRTMVRTTREELAQVWRVRLPRD